jgi:hypothetical protein
MHPPRHLTEAGHRGGLLALWGAIPFSLAGRPPTSRALAINRWGAQAKALPPAEMPLSELPPLPILSLDPSQRVEEAFAQAGLPLHVSLTRRDAPVAAMPCLSWPATWGPGMASCSAGPSCVSCEVTRTKATC